VKIGESQRSESPPSPRSARPAGGHSACPLAPLTIAPPRPATTARLSRRHHGGAQGGQPVSRPLSPLPLRPAHRRRLCCRHRPCPHFPFPPLLLWLLVCLVHIPARPLPLTHTLPRLLRAAARLAATAFASGPPAPARMSSTEARSRTDSPAHQPEPIQRLDDSAAAPCCRLQTRRKSTQLCTF
jgi:hypothetical protein